MEKYAPIIIPTLCRYDKLKVLIDSLANNTKYAKDTELVISLDFPPVDKFHDGYKKIKSYLPTITGFGKVTVIEQTENIGPIGNAKFLVDFVYSEGYDRFIFTEDDNEFSPNFLEYINKGLDKYKDEPNVYSVSGYNFPISMSGYDKNIYGSYHCSAWGCGYWKHKRVNMTKGKLLRFVLKPANFFKLLLKARGFLIGLFIMLAKRDFYEDFCFEIYCFVNDRITVFPSVSKVRNWGHDGSGEHGSIKPEDDVCYNQTIDQENTFDFDDIPLENLDWKPLKAYFHKSRGWYIKKAIQKLFNK